MSSDFWHGFVIGAGLVFGVFTFARVMMRARRVESKP